MIFSPESAPMEDQPSSESVSAWLRRLNHGDAERRTRSRRRQAGESKRLAQRAADCYVRAGWIDEAARILLRVGESRVAAPYFERMERWEEAANAWVAAEQWNAAARCWHHVGRFDQAAECLHRSGQILEAAWLLADRTENFARVEEWIKGVGLEDGHQAEPLAEGDRAQALDRVRVLLIRARCDARRDREDPRGPGRLRDALRSLRLVEDSRRLTVLDWAFAVADALGRVDLRSFTHATAVSLGHPGAARTWSRWAEEELGVALPIEKLTDPSEERSGATVNED